MEKYNWEPLNRQQVGAFAEYFVKMELTMYGFQVYTTEVDDRGIDFVTKYENGPYLEIQVKSIRSKGYVFMQKEKFALNENLYLALAILNQGETPDLYLIPSTAWKKHDAIFVDRNYENLKSKPEWGNNLSMKNMPLLEGYRFENTVSALIERAC
ncbi:MAG: hypothetical protein SRB2_03513 [Desulfobacteraceae bacterium Eth-SRB2]|nr:MAG: hypothetical protein SRB2_03513 [Desulfobacteraceae bacterium Eth-SRB2]